MINTRENQTEKTGWPILQTRQARRNSCCENLTRAFRKLTKRFVKPIVDRRFCTSFKAHLQLTGKNWTLARDRTRFPPIKFHSRPKFDQDCLGGYRAGKPSEKSSVAKQNVDLRRLRPPSRRHFIKKAPNGAIRLGPRFNARFSCRLKTAAARTETRVRLLFFDKSC